MKNYIEDLNWRYATKQFDASKNLEKGDVESLLESIQLTASSYGLQPYEVFVIKDPEIKAKLKPAAFNQSQITDASHLFIFASLKSIDKSYIEIYLKNISEIRGIELEKLSGLEAMLENSILGLTPTEQLTWAQNQTYIALGNFLSAAANLKIDTCPMEGFSTEEFDDILKLSEKNLTTSVIAAVGYRSEQDATQHAPKVRKNKEELFHLI